MRVQFGQRCDVPALELFHGDHRVGALEKVGVRREHHAMREASLNTFFEVEIANGRPYSASQNTAGTSPSRPPISNRRRSPMSS
ncbi:hypothetical protein [Kutzneria sp. CA-103260]|uniref:hypothetical protein n=1 Tax=Kutzneria sp. CA-103260 TaxID=2802641 RepID=UPI001BA5BEFC|nr:hypothetical protein [Kutzneria sp. CA-103260]